jgi:hypothetical protein
MKCYKCAEMGRSSDAVGVCVVCGMGLCMEHARMTEVSFWEASLMELGGTAGLGMTGKVERKVPKILCDICYARAATVTTQ